MCISRKRKYTFYALYQANPLYLKRATHSAEMEVIGYNEIADYCFNKLRKGKHVVINGCIRDNNIEIKNIEMFETFFHFKS